MTRHEQRPPEESLSRIHTQIDAAIDDLETRLRAYAADLAKDLARLDTQRSELRQAADELEIRELLRDQDDSTDADTDADLDMDKDKDALHRRETRLAREHARLRTLSRQLLNFVQLLGMSRQQFQQKGELPTVDDAQRLALRQVIIQAQEDERRRLAREIHDGPAQVLANAVLGLEFVGRSLEASATSGVSQPIEEIDRVKSSMREGLTEIRRFMFDLRPTMLAQRGLSATLEHYLQAFRHLFPGDVSLTLPPTEPRLTTEQELTAFRVIQEGLQNVYRHGRATRTWVRIEVERDFLVVQVRDNGQGFRIENVQASASGGAGLTGMRERAEQIGGRLTIVSAPGEGTVVTLLIPLVTHDRGPLTRRETLTDDPRGSRRPAGDDEIHASPDQTAASRELMAGEFDDGEREHPG